MLGILEELKLQESETGLMEYEMHKKQAGPTSSVLFFFFNVMYSFFVGTIFYFLINSDFSSTIKRWDLKTHFDTFVHLSTAVS